MKMTKGERMAYEMGCSKSSFIDIATIIIIGIICFGVGWAFAGGIA